MNEWMNELQCRQMLTADLPRSSTFFHAVHVHEEISQSISKQRTRQTNTSNWLATVPYMLTTRDMKSAAGAVPCLKKLWSSVIAALASPYLFLSQCYKLNAHWSISWTTSAPLAESSCTEEKKFMGGPLQPLHTLCHLPLQLQERECQRHNLPPQSAGGGRLWREHCFPNFWSVLHEIYQNGNCTWFLT